MKLLSIIVGLSIILLFSTSYSSDLSGKRILFDSIHEQGAGNSDWLIDESYSSFFDTLKKEGAVVNAIELNWDIDVMSDFDIIIIPEPQTIFTEKEKNIIDKLLKKGKSFFIIANGAGIDGNNDGIDSPTVITDTFIKYGVSCETKSFKGNPLDVNLFANTKIVSNSDKVSCWAGTSFKGIKPIIETKDKNIFIGYKTIEKGRVAFCGDADMFGDGTGTEGKKLFDDYNLNTHKDIALNIVKYLAGIITPDESVNNNTGNNTNTDADDYNSSDNPYESKYKEVKDLTGRSLKQALKRIIQKHKSLGYTTAKSIMFGKLDNENGKVYCCYTNLVVSCHGTPNQNIMNCEHTWPQSKFGGNKNVKKCDLNHLYPTDSKANSRRGNHPFGYVKDVNWSKDGSKLGLSSSGETVYEPPDRHKGNVARAIFYFSTCYDMPVDPEQEKALKEWMKIDPVDDKERERNDKVYKYQGNRNPYIDHPEFVSKISDF